MPSRAFRALRAGEGAVSSVAFGGGGGEPCHPRNGLSFRAFHVLRSESTGLGNGQNVGRYVPPVVSLVVVIHTVYLDPHLPPAPPSRCPMKKNNKHQRALFRAFSDWRPPPCNFPPPFPTTRSGAGEPIPAGTEPPAASPHSGNSDDSPREDGVGDSRGAPQRRVGLSAFLAICRRAGLLSPPAVSVSPSPGRRGGGFAEEEGGRDRRRGGACSSGRGRGDREGVGAEEGGGAREAAPEAAVEVAAPDGSYFVSGVPLPLTGLLGCL